MTPNQFEALKFILESVGYLLTTVIALCCAYLHLILYYTINKASARLYQSFQKALSELKEDVDANLDAYKDVVELKYMPRELALAMFGRKTS